MDLPWSGYSTYLNPVEATTWQKGVTVQRRDIRLVYMVVREVN